MDRGTPITPVEETNTSEGWQPRCPATRAAIASTAARPRLPVKALLLPAFTTSARALPSGRASRHHSTSGEGHLLWVVTPATPVSWSSRSEEHTSELQSLMRISYAVFCLKKKNN